MDNRFSMPLTFSVKNVFEKVTFVPASNDKGKKVIVEPYVSIPKSRVVHLPWRQPSQSFVPTCHHCGKVSHTRPNYFKLKPREHISCSSYSRNSHKGLFNMMRVISARLDELGKCHKSTPSGKKIWIRKVDTIHPLRGSDNGLYSS